MSADQDDPIARAIAPRTATATQPTRGTHQGGDPGDPRSREAAATQGSCYLSREDGMVVTLDLEYRTGDREAFPYSLLSRIAYDRSEGITLEYVGAKVEFHGTRLEPLYRALCGHRVLKVSEAVDGFRPDNDAVFVEAIKVAAN